MRKTWRAKAWVAALLFTGCADSGDQGVGRAGAPAPGGAGARTGVRGSAQAGRRAASLAGDSDGMDAGAVEPVDAAVAAHRYFKISVVDDSTKAPVAGTRLTTVSKTSYVADDHGVVAFYEPGVMDRDVWFSPSREGYTATADGFGSVGYRLHAVEGGAAVVTLSKTFDAPVMHVGDLQTRLLQRNVPGAAQCTTIRVLDKLTQRGVPLVTLALPAGDQLTDSQGVVAYCDPDHLGQLSVRVTSHGYASADVSIDATVGKTVQLALERINIAERLYRTTGEGVYRDSLWLGLPIPIRQGALNGQVVGQDSVISAVYKGKLFWTWGDTNNLSYPLGLFTTAAATSQLPASGGLAADVGVDLTYLGDTTEFIRGAVPDIEPNDKPTWVGALVSVLDKSGRERLFASYTKSFAARENGLIEFNDDRQVRVGDLGLSTGQ